jgi:hypothetical protein
VRFRVEKGLDDDHLDERFDCENPAAKASLLIASLTARATQFNDSRIRIFCSGEGSLLFLEAETGGKSEPQREDRSIETMSRQTRKTIERVEIPSGHTSGISLKKSYRLTGIQATGSLNRRTVTLGRSIPARSGC